MYETWFFFFFPVIHPIPVPKSARVCFHQLIFGIQPYAVPNLTASVFYSVPFSGPGVLKNLNKCKLFLFFHFVQMLLPKGLLRIIQNPNNPNRHKCQWQRCGISIYWIIVWNLPCLILLFYEWAIFDNFYSFLTKLDLVFRDLDRISKCLHISLSILTLRNESLFLNAISQRF